MYEKVQRISIRNWLHDFMYQNSAELATTQGTGANGNQRNSPR
ncbi:hypothetical protein ISN40_14060 [Enterobacter asburiae]|nr:hypothetical protein [Enterobacter asburiae]